MLARLALLNLFASQVTIPAAHGLTPPAIMQLVHAPHDGLALHVGCKATGGHGVRGDHAVVVCAASAGASVIISNQNAVDVLLVVKRG